MNKIKESENDRLIQASSTSNFMTEYGMNLALQIYFNPSFNRALFLEESTINDLRGAIEQLNHIRLSTSFIDSIYLYNHLSQDFIVSSSLATNTIQNKDVFIDEYIDSILIDKVYYEENSIYNGKALFIPRELDLKKGDREKAKIVYSLIYKNAFNDYDLSSVIINISSQWFEDILFKNINPQAEKDITDIFAVDNRDRVVMKNQHYDIMQYVGEEEWFKTIRENNLPSGYIIEPIDNEPMLINYYRSHNLQIDWMFISIKPYSSVIKEIRDLRRTIIIFSLFLLLGTIILEAIISKRIYQPISKLLNTLETSQDGREDYQVTLKNNFFRIYLQQRIPLKEEELREEFTKFQINLNFDQKFMMIILKIDNYTEISKDISFKTLSLMKYRILQGISHVLSGQNSQHELVVLQGKFMLILSNITSDETEKQWIERISPKRNSIASEYGVEISLFYSEPELGLQRISPLFRELMNVAQKTIFFGESIILSLSEFNNQEKAKFDYPAKEIKEIIKSLKKGNDFSHIKKLFDDIVNKAGKHSHRALNFCITSLLLELNDLIYSLKTYGDFQIELEIEGMLDDFEVLDDYDVLNSQFSLIFKEIISHQNKAVNKNDELIKEIKKIVLENYSNPLFSMTDMADQFHLTPAYLGKIFTKGTLQSFNDHITQVRIEKSKELLQNSDKPISEIAHDTGFSTGNYFHLVFKKKVGITPQSYRNSHKNRKIP